MPHTARRSAPVNAFERLSPESRYRRFFAPMAQLSERDLDYLTCVDHRDHEALMAIEPEHDGWVVGDEPAVVIEFDFESETARKCGMPERHQHG